MSTQDQYKSVYPAGISVDEGIKRFFERFYEVSDTEALHENVSFILSLLLLIFESSIFKRREWEPSLGRDSSCHNIVFGILSGNIEWGC